MQLRETRPHFNELYSKKKGEDPWGTNWRATQKFRNGFYCDIFLKALSGRAAEKLRVLDIGCGAGVLTKTLYTAFIEKFPGSVWDAVDVSDVAIERAQENCEGLDINFQVSTPGLTELEPGKYDIVLAFEMISYFEGDERTKLFQVMKRCLKKNGICCVSTNVAGKKILSYGSVVESEFEEEMSSFFAPQSFHALYTLWYIAEIEGRLLRFVRIPVFGKCFRWLLQIRFVPFLAHYIFRLFSIFFSMRKNLTIVGSLHKNFQKE